VLALILLSSDVTQITYINFLRYRSIFDLVATLTVSRPKGRIMANVPRQGPADGLRRDLQVIREENNFKAAGRGATFCLRLAFVRLMDRASSRFDSRSPEHTVDHSPPRGPWRKRAVLGVGSVGTLWMTLSPRAHVYLIIAAHVVLHVWRSVIGN
jgi:hypothetical protein